MRNKVVVLTGPTGIGKTDISLSVADHFNFEIINADASSFIKELNIGTAKVNLNNTNIIHHLINITSLNEPFSIKDYQTLARAKIAELHQKNIIPFLVGGSGLYINATINDYELSPSGRDFNEEELLYKDYDNHYLYHELEKLNPLIAKTIHPNNRRRVLRAISRCKDDEVISNIMKGDNLIYDCLIIELSTTRDILYNRIAQRFMEMIASGWVDEVRELAQKGYDLSKIKEIGYSTLGLYIEGKLSFLEAQEEIKKKTRNYAKRQLTWFKNKMETVKVIMNYDEPNILLNEIIALTNDFLINNTKDLI